MRFNFDMDGTIANLYAIADWKERLDNEDATPYKNAEPLVNMSRLARALNRALRKGHEIAIISWGAKNATTKYLDEIIQAKTEWLNKHLPSVRWTQINIVAYGTPKSTCGTGVLFDDEQRNLNEWGKNAYTPEKIFEKLAAF